MSCQSIANLHEKGTIQDHTHSQLKKIGSIKLKAHPSAPHQQSHERATHTTFHSHTVTLVFGYNQIDSY